MKLTDRMIRVVELVGKCRVAYKRHIQIAEYPLVHDSKCELDLQRLVENQWLDVMPNRARNQPAIYRLSKSSVNGIDLLKQLWGEQRLADHMTRIWNLPHLLGITDIRVRVMRACKENNWQLFYWQRSEDLAKRLVDSKLIPDGYFMIQRLADGELTQPAFFLEYELSVKSNETIKKKLINYTNLIYTEQYQQLFGLDTIPRVLFVFAPFYTISPIPRIRAGVKLAEELEVWCARFTSSEQLAAVSPPDCLSQPIWQAADADHPQCLLIP